MTSPARAPDQFVPAEDRVRRPGFVLGLVAGLVIGFGAGVMVDKKGCPPVPVPGASPAGAEAPR